MTGSAERTPKRQFQSGPASMQYMLAPRFAREEYILDLREVHKDFLGLRWTPLMQV